MKLHDINPRREVAKHPTCIEVGECRPPHRRTKPTRHWCKGRTGIPHTWEWQRSRTDLEMELRFGHRYNRVTEHPVCFSCDKVDTRRRSYCRLCGEPWPNLHHAMHERTAHGTWVWRVVPCARCGAPWSLRPRVSGVTILSTAVQP